MNNLSETNEVILSVDTHLDLHVGALISGTGRFLDRLAVATNSAGYLQLLIWGNSFGSLKRADVEGAGFYGAGLTRVLQEHGNEVLEVIRPDRSKHRLQGKPDPTDAENAARSVLAGTSSASPKTHSGAAEALREVFLVRSGAVKEKTQASLTGQCSAGGQRASLEEQTWRLCKELCPLALIGQYPIAGYLDDHLAPAG